MAKIGQFAEPKKPKYLPRKEQQIYNLLEMLLRYNRGGLLPIVNGIVPDTEDALAILDAESGYESCEQVHVQGGNGVVPIQSREERADAGIYRFFRQYGGIQTYVKAFAALRRNDNLAYTVLMEWSEYEIKHGTIENMAEALNIGNTHIYAVKRRGIEKLARYICNTPTKERAMANGRPRRKSV